MNKIGSALLVMAQEYALQAVKDSRWYRTAPAHCKEEDPEIRLTGIEQREVFRSVGMLNGGSYLAPFSSWAKPQLGVSQLSSDSALSSAWVGS